MSALNSEQKKKNVNKSLLGKKVSRLYDSLLRNKKVGTNHIRIFRDGRKIFDYYPLRMKLFDYHNWYQLTYPSFGNGDGKWEQELQEIIGRLSAA